MAPKTLLSHWARELSVVGLADKTKELGFLTLLFYLPHEVFFLISFKSLSSEVLIIIAFSSIHSYFGTCVKARDYELHHVLKVWLFI